MASAIVMDDVHKSFGDVEALQGLSFGVEDGAIFGLLGPNGAGKTTAINVLTTLLRPDKGQVTVAGYDPVSEADRVRSMIGLTGQFAALDDNLTARENLVLFGRLLKLGRSGARDRAAELLDRFGLADAADRRTGGFSGGMRRRLDLAVSMVSRPAVLFLDEPTSGLDPTSRVVLWEVVRELREEGVTILLTTQYLNEADELADQITVIDHGQVVAEGTPAELKSKVGGAVCHLTISDDEVRERAAAALSGRYQVTTSGDALVVPAAGSRVLTDVLATLDAASVEADDVHLRQPTLDDVFFALTGDREPEPAA